ncbi:MAG TPA: hypothetical protein VF720_13795, partial [Candidatus Eisenbacteria bacterium]
YGNSEPSWWPAPANVVEYDIDPDTGRLLEEGCRPRWGNTSTEIFIRGTEPESICPESDYEYTWFNVSGSGDDQEGGDGYESDEEARQGRRDDDERHDEDAPEIDLDGGWIFELGINDTNDRNLRNYTATWQVRLWVDGNDVHGSGEKIAEDGRRVDNDRRTSISLSGQVNGESLRLRLTEYNGEGALSGWFNVDLEGRRLRGEFVSSDAATRGAVSARRSD